MNEMRTLLYILLLGSALALASMMGAGLLYAVGARDITVFSFNRSNLALFAGVSVTIMVACAACLRAEVANQSDRSSQKHTPLAILSWATVAGLGGAFLITFTLHVLVTFRRGHGLIHASLLTAAVMLPVAWGFCAGGLIVPKLLSPRKNP
jgi:hypothetical protein